MHQFFTLWFVLLFKKTVLIVFILFKEAFFTPSHEDILQFLLMAL